MKRTRRRPRGYSVKPVEWCSRLMGVEGGLGVQEEGPGRLPRPAWVGVEQLNTDLAPVRGGMTQEAGQELPAEGRGLLQARQPGQESASPRRISDQEKRRLLGGGVSPGAVEAEAGGTRSLPMTRESEEEFQIFVQMVGGKSLAFKVTHEQRVSQLKTLIHDREGVGEEQQCLTVNGHHTEDRQQLADLGVSPGTTIRLLFRLRGGLSGLTREGEGYGRERPTPGSESSNPRVSPESDERTAQRPQDMPQQAALRAGEVSSRLQIGLEERPPRFTFDTSQAAPGPRMGPGAGREANTSQKLTTAAVPSLGTPPGQTLIAAPSAV